MCLRQYLSRLLIAVISLIIVVLCCGVRAFTFGIIAFPSTHSLAQDYLAAIVRIDNESAIQLATSGGSCRSVLAEDIRKDIAQFGGAELRSVTIFVADITGGSAEDLQIAVIEFEYRRPDQPEWQTGDIRLITNSGVPGFRYVCGNLNYHGP